MISKWLIYILKTKILFWRTILRIKSQRETCFSCYIFIYSIPSSIDLPSGWDFLKVSPLLWSCKPASVCPKSTQSDLIIDKFWAPTQTDIKLWLRFPSSSFFKISLFLSSFKQTQIYTFKLFYLKIIMIPCIIVREFILNTIIQLNTTLVSYVW